MVYRPMTLVDLAARLVVNTDDKIRWKLVWEFLEEYRWEASGLQQVLARIPRASALGRNGVRT